MDTNTLYQKSFNLGYVLAKKLGESGFEIKDIVNTFCEPIETLSGLKDGFDQGLEELVKSITAKRQNKIDQIKNTNQNRRKEKKSDQRSR